jgi:hypothetical protein
MTTNGNYPQSLRVARLYRKTSANGNTYFTGRWGGARISLLKSKDTADDGGEIWDVMLAEALPPKQQNSVAEDPRRDYQRPVAKLAQPERQADGGRPIDDEIPFAPAR